MRAWGLDAFGASMLAAGTPARRLLEQGDGNEEIFSGVPAWATVVILLLIGFAVGAGVGALSALLWLRRRGLRSPPLTPEAEPQPGAGWPAAGLPHKRTASAQLADTMAGTGPLSHGLHIQAQPPPAFTDNPAFRASADTASSLALSYAVQPQPQQQQQQQASVHGSPPAAASFAIRAHTAGEAAQEGGSLAQQVVAAAQQDAAARQAQKLKDVQSLAAAYEMDDIDDGWQEILAEIDARLVQAGKMSLDSQERAVAIRSLLMSTARETPERAIEKAIGDVERYRRGRAAAQQ